MPLITLELLRKRAEHNSGIVSTLEEVSLHGQDIERIDLLGQLCRELKILYLQNNVIGRIENLHKLKGLEYLNLALNNVTQVENLAGCEALQKLDLTANFIAAPAGLLSVASLAANEHLRELFLTGNPCDKADGYRDFVIASLPQLQRLDGAEVTPKERICAAQALPGIRARLEAELAAQPPQDPPEAEGWGPAARLREHLEASAERDAREAARRAQAMRTLSDDGAAGNVGASTHKQQRTGFDPLPPDGSVPSQKNEGAFSYTLRESEDGSALLLEVAVGRFLDTSEIKVDVQPALVRAIIRGKLLQVHTPEEVRPGESACQRSKTTGSLVVTMPKVAKVLGAAAASAGAAASSGSTAQLSGGGIHSLRIVDGGDAAAASSAAPVPHAKLTAAAADSDEPPPL